MSSLAPFAQVAFMRFDELLLLELRLLYLDPVPLLEPIRHPLSVRFLINQSLAKPVALLASLHVDRGVVSLIAVLADGDGDGLAGPSA